MVIKDEILDKIAMGEVSALLDGLEDAELRKNPAFLDKVRRFLAQNKLQTTPETEGVNHIKQRMVSEEIPIFEAKDVMM